MCNLKNEDVQRFVKGRMTIVHDENVIRLDPARLDIWDCIITSIKVVGKKILSTRFRFVTEYGLNGSFEVIETADYTNNVIQLKNFERKPSNSPRNLILVSNCNTVLIVLYEPDQTFSA